MTEAIQVIVIVAVMSVLIIILFVLLGRFFNKRSLPPSTADAALVFGTGVEWKARSRWMTAAQLYQKGIVKNLIVSGGVLIRDQKTTEAEWFRENLIALGVPSVDILIENRARNTLENADYALEVLKKHNFKKVVLVMSDFEGIRAHLTAKRSWKRDEIEIYDYHAPSTGHWSVWGWWLKGSGWRLTWYTLPRLFRYRLWKHL